MRKISILGAALLVLAGCGPTGGVVGAKGTPVGTGAGGSSAAAVAGVPVSAWIDPRKVPLDFAYHWPSLAESARPAPDPKFVFEELCGTAIPPYREHIADDGYQAAQAAFGDDGPGSWHGRETILRWPASAPGDPHGPDGGRWRLNEIAAELSTCSESAPGATVGTAGFAQADHVSYQVSVVTIPQASGTLTLHEYLAWAIGSCALAELSLWSAGDTERPYDAAPDPIVIDALARPLLSSLRCQPLKGAPAN